MQNYGLLTVRSGSTRLPNKCWLELSGIPIIQYVVNRCRESDIEPIICTTTDQSDDKFENFFSSLDIPVFRGSLNNKLKRWKDCARHYELADFHTIDVDDPFFDPNSVLASLELLRNEDLEVVSPTEISSSGAASVGYSFSTNFLIRNEELIDLSEDIEMIDQFLQNFQNLKKRILKVSWEECPNIRLTLDYPEDYELISLIDRELGENPSRNSIETFLVSRPDLVKINLWRNTDWANNQELIRKFQKDFNVNS